MARSVKERREQLDLFGEVERNPRDYYEGNTFHYWIGPYPQFNDSDDYGDYQDTISRLQRLFQKANKVKEVTDRVRRSLISKPPSWKVESQQQQGEEKAASQRLNQWLELQSARQSSSESNLGDPLQKAITDALVLGEGYLRIWSPPKFFNRPDDSPEKMLLHAPDPDSIQFDYDEHGLIESITYQYNEQSSQIQEVQSLDDQGRTIFRYQDNQGNTLPDENGNLREFALPLGGNFTVQRIRVDPIITDSLMRLQDQLNFYLTLLPKNLEFAGFVERIFTNAQPPDTAVTNTEGEPQGAPGKYVTGPNQTAYITGFPIWDSETGNITGYTDPDINYKEPTDPQGLINSFRQVVGLMYEEANQAHILASDQQISGVSRKQLRKDFDDKLEEFAKPIEAALGRTLESVGRALGWLDPSQLVSAQLNLASSDPTPEEHKEIREDFNAGLISHKTTLQSLGYEEPDQEIELVEQEESRNSTPAPNNPNSPRSVNAAST